ncbi:hypothetical protein HK102_010114, partial [Quaeritorhiza haematococci]
PAENVPVPVTDAFPVTAKFPPTETPLENDPLPNVDAPPTVKDPTHAMEAPTFRFLAIPAPPKATSEPETELVESVVFKTWSDAADRDPPKDPLPATTSCPPACTFPATPIPPFETTRAPVDTDVLLVASDTTVLPHVTVPETPTLLEKPAVPCTFKFPCTPVPPETTRAPVDALVDAVVYRTPAREPPIALYIQRRPGHIDHHRHQRYQPSRRDTGPNVERAPDVRVLGNTESPKHRQGPAQKTGRLCRVGYADGTRLDQQTVAVGYAHVGPRDGCSRYGHGGSSGGRHSDIARTQGRDPESRQRQQRHGSQGRGLIVRQRRVEHVEQQPGTGARSRRETGSDRQLAVYNRRSGHVQRGADPDSPRNHQGTGGRAGRIHGAGDHRRTRRGQGIRSDPRKGRRGPCESPRYPHVPRHPETSRNHQGAGGRAHPLCGTRNSHRPRNRHSRQRRGSLDRQVPRHGPVCPYIEILGHPDTTGDHERSRRGTGGIGRVACGQGPRYRQVRQGVDVP